MSDMLIVLYPTRLEYLPINYTPQEAEVDLSSLVVTLLHGTAEVRFLRRDTVLRGSAVHLNKPQNAGNFKLFSHRVLTTAKKAQNLERTL